DAAARAAARRAIVGDRRWYRLSQRLSAGARRGAASPATHAASAAPVQASNGREDMPTTAAPADSSPRAATMEVNPPASTAHTPAAAPAPRRRYSRTCQAPPATGPAGITLASPVDASTAPGTVRHGNCAPPAANSALGAAAPPASDASAAAAATPSQAGL